MSQQLNTAIIKVIPDTEIKQAALDSIYHIPVSYEKHMLMYKKV